MTFKDLVQNNSWSNIQNVFLEVYPEAEDNMEGYKIVFEKLQTMKPEKIDMSIIIKAEIDEDEKYFDVSGLYKNPKTQEEKYTQGIEFTPWRQWLGMEISLENLNNFSETEIIVHCLYEMTFAGFSETEIQNVLKRPCSK